MKRSQPLLLLLLSACATAPRPEPPPTPVTCESHVWGDADGDGRGYYIPSRRATVTNTSGFPLDVSMWAGGPITLTGGGLSIPVLRVDAPGNGWLGLAQVWVNAAGRVRRAEVTMNAGYPQMDDSTIATHVACMEVGHVFGLAHQDAPGVTDSCMNDCAKAGDWYRCMGQPAARTPNAHDFDQLASIYQDVPGTDDVCAGAELRLIVTVFPAPGHDQGEH